MNLQKYDIPYYFLWKPIVKSSISKRVFPLTDVNTENVTYIIKQTMALELGMSKGAHHWH